MSTQNINECRLFSERLKTLRGSRNKAVFSRELGISAQTYQHYENGRIPRSDILSDIARLCDVSVEWLLGRDDTPPPAAATNLTRETRKPAAISAPESDAPGGVCRCPAGVETRLDAMEDTLAKMAGQMETVTALLGAALGRQMEHGRDEAKPRKAG